MYQSHRHDLDPVSVQRQAKTSDTSTTQLRRTRETNNEALQISTCISLCTRSFSVNFVLKRPQFT